MNVEQLVGVNASQQAFIQNLSREHRYFLTGRLQVLRNEVEAWKCESNILYSRRSDLVQRTVDWLNHTGEYAHNCRRSRLFLWDIEAEIRDLDDALIDVRHTFETAVTTCNKSIARHFPTQEREAFILEVRGNLTQIQVQPEVPEVD